MGTRKKYFVTFISLILACLLFFPAHAQEKIYLPLIIKSQNMPNLPDPLLRITDGETIIDLLGSESGFELEDPYWIPKIAQRKGGGVFQDSSLAPGRRLVHQEYENAIEQIPLSVRGRDQAHAIATINQLLSLAKQSGDAGVNGFEFIDDVWIEVRPACNSCNTGYAHVIKMEIPELGSPFSQPFFSASNFAQMDGITLVIEREPLWRSLEPGTGESVTAQSKQLWDYDEGWTLYNSLGAVPDLPAPTGVYRVIAVGDATLIAAPNDSGAGNDVYYSDDHGETWAASTGGGNVNIGDVLVLSDGSILLSDDDNSDRILKSTDNGATFSVASGTIGGGPLVQLLNGNLLGAYNGDDVYRSTDGGSTWITTGSPGTSGTLYRFIVSPVTGTVIAHIRFNAPNGISVFYRSVDSGLSWSVVFTFPEPAQSLIVSNRSHNMVSDEDGNFYAINSIGDIYKSADDGITWDITNTALQSTGYVMFVDSDNALYAVIDTGGGGNTIIYKSTDGGTGLSQVFSFTGEFTPSNMAESDDGDLYIGGLAVSASNGGFAYLIDDAEEFGTSTGDKLYIANKHNIAQLTHIFVADGSIYGTNIFPITAAFSMFPAVPAVGDIIYFGSESSVPNSGPFGGLRLYITNPLTSTHNFTIVWEYWNGAAWTTLTVQNNTQSFTRIGYNSIHWQQPSDWVANSVNSVTAFWVRARISSITAAISTPTHGNAPIIAFNTAFAEILANGVGGNEAALLRLKIKNESGNGGPGGNEPLLYDNRVIVGLRSYSRGPGFVAYLNAADEQNPFGITVTAGTNTAFAADTTTPTGRRATYNPGGAESMATRLTFTLDANIAADFYGEFHIFLRGQRTAGSATDITVRIQIETGSGGVIFTSDEKQFQGTTAWEVLDFDQAKIPVGDLSPTEIGDTMAIRVQAESASGTPNFNIYDLILIPVDEWAIDAVDFANESDSHVGLSGSIQRFLDIDSLTDYRRQVRSIVKQANANERVVSIYDPITNGEAILQANARQRLWFLAMKTSATGTSYNWISEPEVVHSLTLFKAQRYLALRGTD